MSSDRPPVDLTVMSPFVAAINFAVAEATGSRVTGHV